MKNERRKNSKGPGGKPLENLMAWRGFNLNKLPYKKEDLFLEPTQRRLQSDEYSYIPLLNYGNDILDSLYSITQNSPTIAGIIAQKTAYTIAGGFRVSPASSKNPIPLVRTLRQSQPTDQELEELNDNIVIVNSQGQSLLDVIEDIALELWSFGNCFLEVYILGGKLRFRVKSTYLCRPKKAPKGKLYPTEVGLNENWQDVGGTDSGTKDYPLFPEFRNIDGAQRSIIHIKFNSPNFYYWGRPDWLPAKIWGELEYRMAKYNQSRFENGFTPSAIITAYGFQNRPEARRFVDSMKNCFTGTGNHQKMFISAQRDKTSEMDVKVLSDRKEGDFLELAGLTREEVIVGARWSPALAGLSTAGQLGSNQQLRSEFDRVNTTVIKPVQDKIMRSINAAFQAGRERGLEGYSENLYLELAKAMPVTFAGDIDPKQILTINELRAQLGKDPLPEGGDVLLNGNTLGNGN